MSFKRPTGGSTPALFNLGRRDLLRGAAAGGIGLVGASMLPLGSRAAKAATEPKRGGDLRVALTGGAATDTLDAHIMNTAPDLARVMTLYEGLTTLDENGKVINVLAESLEPNATATEWTIKIRKGITFHNGKPFKAEDVAFTFRRIADPKNPLQGATGLKPIDLDGITVVDDHTLKVPTKVPFASLPDTLSAVYYFGIVPVGYDPKNPVGTGPFKYESFTPGQQSVFKRYENYWQSGLPYLDSVTIIDSFQNDTAAFNALQGGEVDVYAYATLSLAKQVAEGSGLKTLVSQPGLYTPFYLRTDVAPFDDVNVRQAFRLFIDRQQVIDQALSGYGIPGDDVFGRWDPAYDSSLKRVRDPEQAKFLLKKSGHENLTVELSAVQVLPGMVETAQVVAQQAKEIGVTINIKQLTVDVYYNNYGKFPFTQDYWVYQPYLTTVALSTLPTSPYNGTHWNNEKYNSLYAQAQSIVDPAKRAEVVHEMQKIDFEQGGFIIPSFNKTVDILAENVQGFVSANTGNALGNFGFAKAWLA
jgi:peptide/nickel transport system substrate-binding protein